MKHRIIATLAGTALAAGLVQAAPDYNARDIVARQLTTAAAASAWQDWHPDAVHDITIRYGAGQPDEHFSYAVAEWDTLPDWKDSPALAEVMKDYAETARSAPAIEVSPDGTNAVATTVVDYRWHGYDGQMTQTDLFALERFHGRWVIRALETTLDYR